MCAGGGARAADGCVARGRSDARRGDHRAAGRGAGGARQRAARHTAIIARQLGIPCVVAVGGGGGGGGG
ncbi:PEP-utilizing enzyme, partial [Nocardia cyriacigeorgica]|uniref:PEP-utilizing enzyme n=1 Tax=Nocardia cyriacigeorgica TaxID=135487 RepID=UPI003CC7ED27